MLRCECVVEDRNIFIFFGIVVCSKAVLVLSTARLSVALNKGVCEVW